MDLTDKVFGELTVIGRDPDNINKWICRCSCGKVKSIAQHSLRAGLTKSCGHLRAQMLSDKRINDMTGEIIGDFEVIRKGGRTKDGHVEWVCTCTKCGYTRKINSRQIWMQEQCKCIMCEVHRYGGIRLATEEEINVWMCKHVSDYRTLILRKCECGKEYIVPLEWVKTGKSLTCGTHNKIDEVGKKYGKLFVERETTEEERLRYSFTHSNNQIATFVCKCECGKHIIASGAQLRGGRCTSCGCDITDKIKNKLLENFGVTNANYIDTNRSNEQIALTTDETALRNWIKENYTDKGLLPSRLELARDAGVTASDMGQAIRKFNIDVPSARKSNEERELAKELNCTDVGNTRVLDGKYEIDMFFADVRIGIEYNGSFWHSSYYKDKMYHFNKSKFARSKGIRLINVYDYELKNAEARDKIVNWLKYEVGILKRNTIGARECHIVEVGSKTAERFYNNYHFKGFVSCSHHIGLATKEDGLLMLMSFSPNRFDKDDSDELVRMVSRTDIAIIGGAEKIIKYYTEKYEVESIVSYCDLDKFSGESYVRMGFKHISDTSPGYLWVHGRNLNTLSRYQCQKKKLIGMNLGAEDETEDQIMQRLGYLKVYNSGNAKYLWTKQ